MHNFFEWYRLFRLRFTCTIFSYGIVHSAPFCTVQKSKLKGTKMAELQYFETGCEENCILRKSTLKFIILIFGIFKRKCILKHYMRRNISSRSVIGVLYAVQHVSEVYFTWRRLLITVLIFFYAFNASVNFLHFTLTLKRNIIFHSHILIFCGYVLECFFSRFQQKTPKILILTWISFFCSPVKLDLPT